MAVKLPDIKEFLLGVSDSREHPHCAWLKTLSELQPHNEGTLLAGSVGARTRPTSDIHDAFIKPTSPLSKPNDELHVYQCQREHNRLLV
jgi:hypothetical protein